MFRVEKVTKKKGYELYIELKGYMKQVVIQNQMDIVEKNNSQIKFV